jgi:hypothetical protein
MRASIVASSIALCQGVVKELDFIGCFHSPLGEDYVSQFLIPMYLRVMF